MRAYITCIIYIKEREREMRYLKLQFQVTRKLFVATNI